MIKIALSYYRDQVGADRIIKYDVDIPLNTCAQTIPAERAPAQKTGDMKTITSAEWFELMSKACRYQQEHNYTVRLGQALFNVLADSHPEIADYVRGTEFDPYYDNSRLNVLQNTIVHDN